MAVKDVDVLEAEAREALVDAARDTGCAEVEAFLVAAALGGDHEAVARDAREAEAVPEHRLRDRATVVRGCVEEVDAEVEGAADGGAGDVAGDVAKDVAERGGAEADGADAEARAAEVAELDRKSVV